MTSGKLRIICCNILQLNNINHKLSTPHVIKPDILVCKICSKHGNHIYCILQPISSKPFTNVVILIYI